jgi:hypothetical protein
MAAYNATMQLLFGWAHPYLQAALTWLGSFIGWRPTLYPHWRDVFIVLALMVAGVGRAARPEPRTALTVIVIGAFTAFISSMGVGVLPIQSEDALAVHQLVALVPVLALLLPYTWSSDADTRSTRVFALLTLALACIFLVELTFTGRRSTPGIGLILLVFAAVGIGAAWTIEGAIYYYFGRPERHGKAVGMMVAGLTILGGFIGAAFVAAVDAGLKLLGA